MKLIIDIPAEFETDYNGDKFKDFFSRVLCDIDKGVLCGNYEKETAEMFLKAFDESVPMANILEKLEESQERYDDVAFMEMNTNGHTLDFEYAHGKKDGVQEAINIVKQEINKEN